MNERKFAENEKHSAAAMIRAAEIILDDVRAVSKQDNTKEVD